MLLNNCICTNMLNVAIHKRFRAVKGRLACVFIWMSDYLSFISVLFDIVSRAVEAKIRGNMPTARTNKEKIEYREIKFFIAITPTLFYIVKFFIKKHDFAVHALLCEIFANIKGGDIRE